MLPMQLCRRWPLAEQAPRALALLAGLGIAEQAHKLPADLSGGQQQRAAVARALANDAPLIVADEPTGQLDSGNGALVLGLLAGLAATGRTVVVATHERSPGPGFSRTVILADGRLA
jgi:putative ABC transport system ATP-binding protein